MAEQKMGDMCVAKSIFAIILGLLILGNAYWAVVDWASFIGIILIIVGLLKLIFPYKHHR